MIISSCVFSFTRRAYTLSPSLRISTLMLPLSDMYAISMHTSVSTQKLDDLIIVSFAYLLGSIGGISNSSSASLRVASLMYLSIKSLSILRLAILSQIAFASSSVTSKVSSSIIKCNALNISVTSTPCSALYAISARLLSN